MKTLDSILFAIAPDLERIATAMTRGKDVPFCAFHVTHAFLH